MTDEIKEEVEAPSSLVELLNNIPNAPLPEQIEKWKRQFGDIFMTAFSETEVFIFRALKRGEHKQLQVKNQVEALKAQERERAFAEQRQQGKPIDWVELEKNLSEDLDAEFKQQENVVMTCVLWPEVTSETLSNKAGNIPVLHEQIMQNSNFLTPAQASQLVMKL